VDWTAQVECGNQYMRAKQVFEAQWAREHEPGKAVAPVVVLGNGSVGGVGR
jgi:tetraacyldisaccharide-1-P 4'-kinase